MLFTSIGQAYHHFYNKRQDWYFPIDLTNEENDVIEEYATNLTNLRWGKPKWKDTSKKKLHDATFLAGSSETIAAKLFGHKQSELEFDVGGDASDYAHSDLQCIGIDLGVKCSKFGLPHLVVRNDMWTEGRCGDEIICTVYEKDIERDEKTGKIKKVKRVVVNGVATTEVLKKYQSRDLIFDKSCEKYADRAGFFGYKHLKPLHTEKDIEAIKAEYKIFS